MAEKMQERELISLIQAHEGRAYGWGDGVLAVARAESIRRFLAKPYGNEQEGRSKIVSTDLRDTVLWIIPQVMRTLFAGDEVCKFEPIGPEDEQQAELESSYINHVMLQRNNAYQSFSAFVQDALVSGNGYAKVWWDKKDDVRIEKYFGKSDDELALLMQDDDVEVVSHRAYPDEADEKQRQQAIAQLTQQIRQAAQQPPPPQQPGQPPQPSPVQAMQQQLAQIQQTPPVQLHDVVMRRKRTVEFAKFECVPPEEILIGAESRNLPLQDVDFVQHRRELSLSEIRQMGFDVPDDIGDQFGDSDPRHSQEEIARNRYSSEYIPGAGDDAVGPAMRRVVLRETFLRCDFDGDGIGELRKVVSIGNNVLANEETDLIPIVSFVAVPFAHRHHGISHHELIADIAEARTEVIRAYLDGLKVNVRPRLAIDGARVNQNDLLVARPNGLVRTQGAPQESIMPLPVSDTGQMAMTGLQWLDAWRMDASGINQAMQSGQSVDASALNKTALGMSQQLSMALARVENITRSLADGLRDLVLLMHALTLHHASKADHIKLNNRWTVVDPREWVRRDNLTVTVSLGAGTKEMRAQQLMMLVDKLSALVPLGVVKPQNLYNVIGRLVNELGMKNADEFVSNPQMEPQQPPQVDPIVQAEQVKAQSSQQIAQMKAQSEAQQAALSQQLKERELQVKSQADAMAAEQAAQIEREKIERQALTDVEVARIKAQAEIEKAVAIERVRLEAQSMSAGMDQQHIAHMQTIQQALQSLVQSVQAVSETVAKHSQPKQVVRDQRGRVAGVAGHDGQMLHQVVRDSSGRVSGIAPANQ